MRCIKSKKKFQEQSVISIKSLQMKTMERIDLKGKFNEYKVIESKFG